MNVPIPKLAQSTRFAATVWGATLVSASPDLNPAGERRVSRARDRCVEMWMSVPATQLFVVLVLSVPTSQENTVAPACLGSFHLLFGVLRNLRLSNVQGSFKCKEDVMPNNEWVQLCQDGAAVKPKYVSFCAVMNATFSVLDDACKKTTAVSLKNTAERFASVIEKTFTRSVSPKRRYPPWPQSY